MKIVDKVFGEIEYQSNWCKKMKVPFMGKEYEVLVAIYGEDDGIFEEGQYKSYEELWKKWDSFQEEILTALYKYYVERQEVHGLGEKEGYPAIEDKKELLPMIELARIVVDYESDDGTRNLGIIFNCDWSDLGAAVRLENEEIVEVGSTLIIPF